MEKKAILPWLDGVARLLLAAVFIYAAWSKLQDPALFSDVIKSYKLVPSLLAGWMALVLPPLEMIAGVMLLVSKWSREAALVISGMLVVFIVGLAQAWVRGLEIDCGCFGSSEPGSAPPLWLDIIRDLGLLLASGWLVVRPNAWIFGKR